MSMTQAPKHRAAAPTAHLALPCWDACSRAPRQFETITTPGGQQYRMARESKHSAGDVRRCEHGHIWYCTGNEGRRIWLAAGFWIQLDPIFNPIRYRKAKKALAS